MKKFLLILFITAFAILAIWTGAHAQTTQIPGARTIRAGTVYFAIDSGKVKDFFMVYDSSIKCPVSYYTIHDTIRIHDTVYQNPVVPTLVTIFTTQTPPTSSETDGQSITVGVKFRSAVTSFVKGIRFFKTDTLTGKNHIGYLYNLSGAILDSGVFVNESASGWQTLTLTKNIQLTANTTYIAAYYSPTGQYSSTNNTFNTSITNSIITGLASGTDGVNGVYNYGKKFPTLTYLNSSYLVDVIISTQK